MIDLLSLVLLIASPEALLDLHLIPGYTVSILKAFVESMEDVLWAVLLLWFSSISKSTLSLITISELVSAMTSTAHAISPPAEESSSSSPESASATPSSAAIPHRIESPVSSSGVIIEFVDSVVLASFSVSLEVILSVDPLCVSSFDSLPEIINYFLLNFVLAQGSEPLFDQLILFILICFRHLLSFRLTNLPLAEPAFLLREKFGTMGE